MCTKLLPKVFEQMVQQLTLIAYGCQHMLGCDATPQLDTNSSGYTGHARIIHIKRWSIATIYGIMSEHQAPQSKFPEN